MKRVLLFVVVFLGMALLIPVGAFVYNEYIFGLGKLHKSLAVGDSYDEVYSMYSAYIDGRTNTECFQFSEGIRENDFSGLPIAESKYLFIYDCSSLFDDVQLGVLFDGADKVKKLYFVGD